MKRRIVTILIFLLLGAMVNVAVAWGCALWSPQDASRGEREMDVQQAWPSYLESLGWPAPNHAVKLHLSGPGDGELGATVIEITGGDSNAGWSRSDPADQVFVSLKIRLFGLPFRALQWELHGVRAGSRSMEMVQAAASTAGMRTGIDVSKQAGGIIWQMRRLPLTLIWPGFLVNALFYTAILWLLIPGPFVLRRLIRRKRGRCIKCGYDLRGSPEAGCPECGSGRDAHGATRTGLLTE